MAETEIDAKHIDALNNLEDEFEDAEVELRKFCSLRDGQLLVQMALYL